MNVRTVFKCQTHINHVAQYKVKYCISGFCHVGGHDLPVDEDRSLSICP